MKKKSKNQKWIDGMNLRHFATFLMISIVASFFSWPLAIISFIISGICLTIYFVKK